MADAPEFVPSRFPSHQHGGLSSTNSFITSSHVESDRKDAIATPGVGPIPEQESRWSGRKFWGLIVLTSVIIAAAVGGGVGGTLAVQHAKSKACSGTQSGLEQIASSPIPVTVTVTATAEASVAGTASAQSSPAATPSTFSNLDPLHVDRVDISCPKSLVLNSWRDEAFDCFENTQVSPSTSTDLMGITAYTLQTCIDACSTWNQLKGGGCYAVSMEWDLSYAYQNYKGANCFLRGTSSPTGTHTNVTSLILG